MIFNIINTIFTITLSIALIATMYNIIVGIRIKSYQLIVLSGIEAGLIGMLFGLALSSILFNI